MSLLLNMLSRLVITFLPRSKRLLMSWLQSPSAVILEPKKNEVWHCFPIHFPGTDGPDAMIFVFWMLSQIFHSPLSLSSRGFLAPLHFCHKGGVICISEVIDFLLAILIPACVSSSPVFLMMYSAYKLNKQCDNMQPWRTPFPIWNQSVVPCPVLTVASWPSYRFLKRQVRDGLVFPSLSEFSTVYCDPHSQRFRHSQ